MADLDPALAKQLYDTGAISQSTYNAAINNQASVDPNASGGMSSAPIVGPQPPPPDIAPQIPLNGGTSSAPAPERVMSNAVAAPQPIASNEVPLNGGTSQPPEATMSTPPEGGMSQGPTPPHPSAPKPSFSYSPSSAMSASAAKPAQTSMDLRDKQLTGRQDLAEDRANKETDAETKIAEAKIDGAQKTAFIINQQLSDQDAAIKRRDNMQLQASNDATKTIDDLTKQYQALGNTKIDPDRKWKSLSPNEKFATGASIFLSGMAGGLGDGRFANNNVGLQQWQQKIDRDVQAQMHDIQNRHGALDAETNLMAKKYAIAGDMVGYENAKQAEGWVIVGHRLDALAQETKDPIIRAELEKGKLQIQAKVDDARNNLQDFQFARLQRQEQLAAQAAAMQRAKYEAMQKEAREKSWKLQTEHDMTPEEADRRAWRSVAGLDIDASQGPMGKITSKEEMGLRYHPDTGKTKDIGERTVVVDGKEQVALNKTAAEKWNEYTEGREQFANALDGLKKARDQGNVGAYNANRAILIETAPKLFGFNRAPTQGQIKVTLGPEAVPEYNHWYHHAGALGATYKMAEGRAAEKIKVLEDSLGTADKAARQATFGVGRGVDSKAAASKNVNDMPWEK